MEGTRGQSNDEEYRVKAAFLFHFAQLVDWPADPLTATDEFSLSLHTWRGPVSGSAGSYGGGQSNRESNHSRSSRLLHKICRFAKSFSLGNAQSKRIPALLADLHNAPILTVGETPGFLGAGGMIRFVLEDNNVRFGINLDAAASAKLKIGSRLLILAQTVIGESREK